MDTPARGDSWQPEQYHRFREEREAPFRDLCAWLEPRPGAHAIDLGCGTGELTRALHMHLGAAQTVGLDSSANMLERAAADATHTPGVTFTLGDIGHFDEPARYDVVFSHAALHWVPDHPQLFARLAAALKPGGQLAVQMPANFEHISQATLREVLRESPFSDMSFEPGAARNVLAPADYATLLHTLSLNPTRVARFVYGHLLPSVPDAVEWMKGTTMTPYAKALAAPLYEELCARVTRRLLDKVGDVRPYHFTFERILLWARRPA